MTDPTRRLLRVFLAAYPRWFRRDHGDALLETSEDRIVAARRQGGGIATASTFAAEVFNMLVHGVRTRIVSLFQRTSTAGPQRPASPRGRPPITSEIMHSVSQDVRFAMRDFRKNPGFVVAALLLLGLGIASNTTIFSLLHAYLLRPLPFPHADRLVDIAMEPTNASRTQMALTPEGIWEIDWPERDAIIEHFVSWDLDELTIVGDDRPEAVRAAWATPGYFGAFATAPHLGRFFTDDDGRPGAPPVTVISHGLWQRRFGGDPDIIGKTVTAYSGDRPLDAEVFTIVGVLPLDYWFFNRYTEMIPALTASRPPYMLRLQPGVTYEQAAQHLTDIVRAQIDGVSPEWRVYVHSTRDLYAQRTRPTLIVLASTAGLVLLIACGNVAILLMVRAVTRDKELTVRRALGASQSRITRQLLTEGILLAGGAGVIGIALAAVGLRLLAPTFQTQLGAAVPGGVETIGLNPIVLLVTVVLSVTTGIVFALIPALTAAKGDLTAALKEGGRSGSDSPRRQLVRNMLIGGEVAGSLALLIGAGLMMRSVMHIGGLELGFDPENVLTANITLRLRSYPEAHDQVQFVDDVLERFRTHPGVVVASIEGGWPFHERLTPITTESEPDPGIAAIRATPYRIGEAYFRVMNIPVLRGRAFTRRDGDGSDPVAIVSQELANQLWPGEDPIGKRTRQPGLFNQDEPWRTVVGVVGDVREHFRPRPTPDIYVPFRQSPWTFVFVLARITGPTAAAVQGLQQVVWAVDPTLAVSRVEMVEDLVAEAGARPRFLAGLLSAFSVFAVALSLFGMYSVISYAARQREQEVAIRMALGAPHRQVVRLFLRQGGLVVGLGLLVGVIGSLLLTRTLASQLYGVTPTDVPTYAAAVLLLGVCALVAVWLPARKAAGTDPLNALRQK